MAIVFRALGFVSDRQILEHICYDFDDLQMLVWSNYDSKATRSPSTSLLRCLSISHPTLTLTLTPTP